MFTLVTMRLRRVPPGTVMTARISAVKAGLDISINELEAHYLAAGNVVSVVNAMISADKADISKLFQRAAASIWPAATCWKRYRCRFFPR